jgi:autonomous glycyl radical cofactor GrcA
LDVAQCRIGQVPRTQCWCRVPENSVYRRLRIRVFVVAVTLTLTALNGTSQTIFYSRGQNVAPSFEGWEENPDGTFDLVFGYLNRNLDEELDIPIGPDNSVEPGGPDQGQPTHLLPRRNRYVFRVRVPKDFGNKEVVWTLTAHEKTERAYATLKPDYVIDRLLIMKDTGALGTKKYERANKAPVVRIEGDAHRNVKVGEPITLTAFASDDGIPRPRAVPQRFPVTGDALGLRVAWFVYRGAGKVTFDPEQFKVYTDYRSNSPWTPGWAPPPVPADGKFPVTVTFSRPGTFVIRVMAHDGGLQSTQDVTVTATSAPVR